MARSNRQLTQFVVDKIRFALIHGPEALEGTVRAGNTEVVYDTCNHCERPGHLVVRLFDKEIIRLVFSPLNNRVVCGLIVSTGDFYDGKGRPSRTTRERLNGILDSLGAAKFIPQGVRVFLRSEDDSCYIGKGDACKAFNSARNKVLILSHPTDLVFS